MSRNGVAFKRRELIIKVRRFDPNTGEPIVDNENTPSFTFIGDRCNDLDRFKVGDVVAVSFDLQGRKYTDQSGVTKIINDIRPYKVEMYVPRHAQPQQPQQPQQAQQAYQQQPQHVQQQTYAQQPYAQPQPQGGRGGNGGGYPF
jgi:single-stranded DNA-binding protein